MTGVSMASDYGWGSPQVLGVLVVAIVILAIYIVRQLHATTPILNFRVFASSKFRVGALLVMLDFGVTLSTMYLLPMFWQNGLAIAVALTGIVMLPGGVVNAIVSAVAGRIYDNIGARKLVIMGFLLTVVGIAMLILTTKSSAIWYVILAHIIIMIGVPLSMSPAQTFALNVLDRRSTGDGSTIMNTFQQIVGAIATAVSTSLLGVGQHLSSAATGSQTAFTSGVHYGLIFPMILAIIGFVLAFRVKDRN